MRIALITYEYPPDTAVGGIATYMAQWARALTSRGHKVEVFCSSPFTDGSELRNKIYVHKIKTISRLKFKELVLEKFTERHNKLNFQLAETAELHADGKIIKEHFPDLFLVIKLHTPTFLINDLNNENLSPGLIAKTRTIMGAWRRLEKPKKYWNRFKEIEKEELEYLKTGNLITSPSTSLKNIIRKKYPKENLDIRILPNPYDAQEELLQMQCNRVRNNISFFGRLETRKGILAFIEIIPEVLKKHPDVKFQFIGADTLLAPEGISARQLLSDKLKLFIGNISFFGHIELAEIPDYLNLTDVCVFPSIWENFPTVCLEAMSAGKAVIGSKNGGMAEMLENNRSGFLTDPSDIIGIAAKISYLIEHPEIKEALGIEARRKVLTQYSSHITVTAFEQITNGI